MDPSIWLAIAPGPDATRLIAQRGPRATILKAHLRPSPVSSQALVRLLEALALWEGQPIRAALVVDDDPAIRACALYREGFPPCESTPLYQLEWVPRARPRRRRDPLRGMGEFRDLEHLLRFEIAR
jgi:hypothetical protein